MRYTRLREFMLHLKMFKLIFLERGREMRERERKKEIYVNEKDQLVASQHAPNGDQTKPTI